MTYTLEQLKSLEAAATKGPWIHDYDEDNMPSSFIVVKNEDGTEEALIQCYDGPHDTAFVAAARTAIPELLAEIESLRIQLWDAATEINCAGPIAHRIRMLRKQHNERIAEMKAEILEFKKKLSEQPTNTLRDISFRETIRTQVLVDLAKENDELRKLVNDAPHEQACAYIQFVLGKHCKPSLSNSAACDCWKSKINKI